MVNLVSVRGDRRLSLLLILGALGCSLLEGAPQSDEDDGDACDDGEVRECTGPQGCSGLTVCEDGRAGDCVCGAGGTGAGGTGAGTGGTSGGGACEDLRACCESPSFDASARQSCLDLADTGIASACDTAYTTYRDAGICGGGGGGTSGTGAGGSSTGGVAGSGNQGGTSGTGGGGPACGTSFNVTAGGYVLSPGKSGCWSGYAYTFASPGATISPSTFTSCGTPCMLCVAGTVPPTADFSGVALVGYNTAETFDSSSKTSVTPMGYGLLVNHSRALPVDGLRIQILGPNGDTSASERWCAVLPSDTAQITIPYGSFNTQCWEGGTGEFYRGQPITGVQLLVPGNSTTAVNFDVCLYNARDE